MIVAALPILAPLAVAVLVLVLRRYAAGLALSGAAVALAGAIVTLARVADGDRFSATLPGLPGMPLLLAVDPFGALFSTVVAVTSAFVLVYAVGYMAHDEDQARFYAGMAFFVTAMQVLVLAGDWLLLLAAWELIGLASYLLIGFWYTQPGVGAAATRAFLVTRAADLGLYVAVFILIADRGSSSITASEDVGGAAAALAGVAFLLAVMGKSAQVPLQGWLQDAMVGPTPVSALLHAATLVVAGVVLLTRAFPLLPDAVLLAIGLLGGLTAIITGVMAFAQGDLKRLLAGSTSSQVGLMLLALGSGSLSAAVFHLVTQAAMKSTLFLGAGVFQHDQESTAFEDLRGIGRRRPAVFAGFVVAGLALAGVPPLAGFWSKDAIIAATMNADAGVLLVPLAIAGSATTGLYIGRSCRLLWQGDVGSYGPAHVTGDTRWMGAGIGVLAAAAALLGLSAGPFGHLIDMELPERVSATVAGLLAAAVGLLLGWSLAPARLLGGVSGWARDGFRIGGGWDALAVHPALAIARRADALDDAIHGVVLRIGRGGRTVAGAAGAVDRSIHAGVLSVGHASRRVAQASSFVDEEGINGVIRRLVEGTRRLGATGRQLQSGLVHRELLVAFGGTAAVLILVLIV